MDRRLVFKHYKDNFLLLDLAASLPLDLFGCLGGSVQLMAVTRFSKLLRTVRLRGHLSILQAHVRRYGFSDVRVTTRLLGTVFSVMVFVNHWFACLWVVNHRYLMRNSSKSWAIKDGLCGESRFDPSLGTPIWISPDTVSWSLYTHAHTHTHHDKFHAES